MTTKIMNAKFLLALGFSTVVMAGALFSAEAQPTEVFQKAPDRPVDLVHDKNLFIVGYTHLDTQWRWSYPQVIRAFIGNTLRDNFALLEKYPNYVYNFSGSRRYEMMAEYYPTEYAKMKEYIAAGRWFPAGSSVDEGDSMVPSAESLVRQVLYGNRYFRREFGIASEEFMLPDCFGFPSCLPTILAHAGVKGFSTQKLGARWGSAIGIPFKIGVWEGPDGRSVVAAFDPGSYNAPIKEDLSKSESWLRRINNTGTMSGAYVDYHYYGVGDQGGAPAEDGVRWLERSIVGGGPIRVISSRADEMFKALQPDQIAKLPRYKGELLLTEHSAGSITSQAYMKRWNRKNELLADAAERASVGALCFGATSYPTKKLYDAWDLVLGAQMHDMLPGTSLPKAYEYCWNDELLAANQFSAVLENGVGFIAADLDTQTKGVALVVFNPLSIDREDIVEATVAFPGELPVAVSVVAPDGRKVVAQILGREGDKLKIAFVAAVPSVGFAVFDVSPAKAPASTDTSLLRVSSAGLENEYYRVTVAKNGDVASIYDKRVGREVLAAPARLAFLQEKPLLYPAWNMDWSDRQKAPRAYVDGPAKVRIVESGPARVALEIEREAEGSRFVQTLRLAAGGAGDRVEFATRIDWQTVESSLKATFPFSVSNPVAIYDSQVGIVERGNNDPKKYEVPQHQWFGLAVPDKSFGVAVLNDSKFGSDKPDDNTLRLTLLYTPGTRFKYQDQGSQDFGRHDILYAVTSHIGDWRKALVPWSGSRLNQPLLAFQSPSHPGALGRAISLFKISNKQVALTAVKKAEDGDEVIVRFQELTGEPARYLRFSTMAGIVGAREVDGQERPLGAATVDNGQLTFDLGGYGLRAFALKLGAPIVKAEATTSLPLRLDFNEDVVSTHANRADGRFDSEGRSYPAEQLSAKIVSEGVEFITGPTTDGKPNAVAARGQSISLPEGNYNRVYFLASSDGDTKGSFIVDGKLVALTIQNWTGYIGQWDNRLWEGEVPELTYSWFNALAGLEPGFTKRGSVAWYCSHRHNLQGDDHYIYSYLFKYGIDLPAGAKTIALPNNPKIRIFAASVACNTHDNIIVATPLFDRLDDRQSDAPKFSPAGGRFSDATQITIQRPLYWRAGGLHFTFDGSRPTITSPVYTGPITINQSVVVTACEFDATGRPSPLATATYQVNDTTPPRMTSAFATSMRPFLRVGFSEPIQSKEAETAANYQLAGATKVLAAKLALDRTSVVLTLSAPLEENTQLTVQGICDTSPASNVLDSQSVSIDVNKPVFQHASLAAGQTAEINAPAIPIKKGQPWTMNLFVRPTKPIDNRTLIAGFGRVDNTTVGTGRYFAKFANGAHLWLQGETDLESTTALRLNEWQMLTATYDGEILRLYIDGRQTSWLEIALGDDEPIVRLAPLDPWDKERRFQGDLRGFAIWDRVLPVEALRLLQAADQNQ
jgi:alpha-mannosidase